MKSKSEKPQSKSKGIVIVVILGLLIIAVIANTIRSISNEAYLRANGVATTAFVTDLRHTYTQGSFRPTIRVYASYWVDEVLLVDRRLPINPRNTYRGEVIPIYFSASNPNRITPVDRSRTENTPWRMVFIFVVLPAYICLLWLMNRKNNSERINKILKTLLLRS